jgi:predicted ATPase
MADIRTPDQRLRVFISSTMEELSEERIAVRKAVEDLHLIPVLFELGARSHPPRDLYRAYLEQSDIFIGIYFEQYGWTAPGATISGIEDEYDLAAGMPKLIYVREPAPERDPRLRELLDRISGDDVSYRQYRDAEELLHVVEDDVAVLLSERFQTAAPTPHIAPVHIAAPELPSATTRFVGRQHEMADLHALMFDPDVRLVTLTGPGGIGKSRLALAVAREAQKRFADGVVAVMLAPVRTPDLVASAMLTALGVSATATRSVREALLDFLRDREMLLVIDNFEHVMPAAPLVADLLQESSRLRIVVTSREMLRLSGEHIFPVPPLGLTPEPDGQVEAVELFLDRARAIRHDLTVSEDVVGTVTEICRRLDGLPLAIELAAARVRVLSPQDILQRLDSRLKLLTRGPSDLPERQRTLRDTIEWSYSLLDEDEQRLFECLGIFRGGFTLDAAEGVIKSSLDILEGLASLMDKSLIRSDATAEEPRFMMLETLREFAKERLTERGIIHEVRRAHAEYFTTWAAALDTEGQEAEAVRAMELDNDNLRAALSWYLENDDPVPVARAAAVVWKFWWVRSLFVEGIEWMDRVKATGVALPQKERADVEFVRGMLAFGHGNYEIAAESLQAARTDYEEIGYIRGAAMTWIAIGVVDSVSGRPGGEELLWRAGNLLKELADDWAAAFALFGLGRVLMLKGRGAEAVPVLEESVDRAMKSGSSTLLAFALVNLGWTRLDVPDIDGAEEVMRRSLEEGAAIGARESIARALEALAAVADARGVPERAAVMFGAAEAVRRSTGAVVWVPDRPTHAAVDSSLRSQLGEDRFQANFQLGLELSVQEAVDLACSSPDARDEFASGAVTGA